MTGISWRIPTRPGWGAGQRREGKEDKLHSPAVQQSPVSRLCGLRVEPFIFMLSGAHKHSHAYLAVLYIKQVIYCFESRGMCLIYSYFFLLLHEDKDKMDVEFVRPSSTIQYQTEFAQTPLQGHISPRTGLLLTHLLSVQTLFLSLRSLFRGSHGAVMPTQRLSLKALAFLLKLSAPTYLFIHSDLSHSVSVSVSLSHAHTYTHSR